MVKGVTESGFKYSVDKEAVQDMEFIELVAESQKNPAKLPEMILWVLGEEQKKKLYDHVRTKKGRVPLDKIDAEFTQILQAVNQDEDTKN